jgi:protein TonB
MNIKPYVLPASIAAVLHTALVLAFPQGPALPAVTTREPEKPVEQHVQVDLPPPPPPEERSPDVPVTQLKQGSQPVEIPEPPAIQNHTDFTVEPTEAIYHPDHNAVLGPIGVPEGIGPTGVDRIPSTFLSPVDLDRTPRTTAQIPPDYPSSLRSAGIGGEVLVEFTVDATGRVLGAQVIKSTRHEFEAPTIRAVLRWRFEPGKRNGRPVPFRMVVPVDFSVGDI